MHHLRIDRELRQRGEAFFQREQIYARPRAAGRDFSAREFQGDHDRGRRRNLRSVAAARDDFPGQPLRRAVRVVAGQRHVHRAGVAAGGEKPFARALERRRVPRKIAHETCAHEPRQQPHAEVEALQFEPGAKP
ncbi:hypothetical protein [Tahibacter soli]|uniref:Uncharacterized protein n=1 Tax=Tahibacter soli TaxID=2983605 RepID=A0A9X4BLZ5_9GAMM|nr:hypothetical protein [Tahibacter soli]MDC8015807.1 hypothetical protein [Tahibacter soli]